MIFLLSDRELQVKRSDTIDPPHCRSRTALLESSGGDAVTWGELESHGGVILDPLPDQDPDQVSSWKVCPSSLPNLNYEPLTHSFPIV